MAKAGDQYDFRTGNLWSVAQRDDVKAVARLLSEGLDPEMRNKVGWTALHAAANGGAERVVTLLLKRGIDIDARCRAGRTPLAEAARSGHLPTVKVLVRAGADPAAEDNAGRRVGESAKGTALREWILARCPPSRDRTASDAVGVDERPTSGRTGEASRARRADHLESTGGGRREKLAERQKVGISGKAKAKLLKQARQDARERSTADTSISDVVVAPAGGEATVDGIDHWRHARQPLPPQEERERQFCLRAEASVERCTEALAPLLAPVLPPPLTPVCSSPAATTPTAAHHVLVLVVDARHPLLGLADGLYLALRRAALPFVLCLTKADLVSAAHLQAWKAYLRAAYPLAAAVVDVSATGKRLTADADPQSGGGSGAGVASRRRWLSSHLTSADRQIMREDAERLAAACGVSLPPSQMRLVRGVWKAMARSTSAASAVSPSGFEQGTLAKGGIAPVPSTAEVMRAGSCRLASRRAAATVLRAAEEGDEEVGDEEEGEEEEGEEEEGEGEVVGEEEVGEEEVVAKAPAAAQAQAVVLGGQAAVLGAQAMVSEPLEAVAQFEVVGSGAHGGARCMPSVTGPLTAVPSAGGRGLAYATSEPAQCPPSQHQRQQGYSSSTAEVPRLLWSNLGVRR